MMPWVQKGARLVAAQRGVLLHLAPRGVVRQQRRVEGEVGQGVGGVEGEAAHDAAAAQIDVSVGRRHVAEQVEVLGGADQVARDRVEDAQVEPQAGGALQAADMASKHVRGDAAAREAEHVDVQRLDVVRRAQLRHARGDSLDLPHGYRCSLVAQREATPCRLTCARLPVERCHALAIYQP